MSKPRTFRSAWKLVTVGLALALLPTALFAGSAGAQAKTLTVGSKDFSGAQVLSQAYGQALEAKGYDISFKDNIGATEIVYAALENGDLDALRRLPGHAAHLPRRRGRPVIRRRTTGGWWPSSGAPTSWPAGRRPRST